MLNPFTHETYIILQCHYKLHIAMPIPLRRTTKKAGKCFAKKVTKNEQFFEDLSKLIHKNGKTSFFHIVKKYEIANVFL